MFIGKKYPYSYEKDSISVVIARMKYNFQLLKDPY